MYSHTGKKCGLIIFSACVLVGGLLLASGVREKQERTSVFLQESLFFESVSEGSALNLHAGILVKEEVQLLQHKGSTQLTKYKSRRSLQETDTSVCDPLLAEHNMCLASNPLCNDCLDAAIDELFTQSNTTTCTDFEAGVCPAIATECACGDLLCRQAAENFWECVLAALEPDAELCQMLDCNLGSATVAPTPAPTQDTSVCDPLAVEHNMCLVSNPLCGDCLDAAIDELFAQSSTTSCTGFEAGVCPAIATECPCGDLLCRQAAENFFECILAALRPDAELCQMLDCNLGSATIAPTPAPTQNCPQEREDINFCPSITQECADCVNDAFGKS